MKRENRYVVVKRKDILAHLTKTEEHELGLLIEKVDAGRKKQGKEEINCVVVESDWPEYEKVWGMLERREDMEQANNACNRSAAKDDRGR